MIFVAVRIDRVFKKHQVHHRRHQHHSHPSNGATSTKYCKIFVKRINVKAEIYSFILAECVSNLNYARLFILDIIFFVVSCMRHSGCLRLYRLGARIDVCVEQDSCHCVRLWFCVFFFVVVFGVLEHITLGEIRPKKNNSKIGVRAAHLYYMYIGVLYTHCAA